ncbi:hypothetical protein BDN72DRAFT_723299, partial [Pluteus cervinus]
AHPYWYAQVLGIYFASIQHIGPNSLNLKPQRMEFLWVRWLGTEHCYRIGRAYAHLPKVGFVQETDSDAFGFLDPSLIIRGVHLIPSFVDGRTQTLLSTCQQTAARPSNEVDDWTNYYVNIFVDRDMYMRFLGGGIGH